MNKKHLGIHFSHTVYFFGLATGSKLVMNTLAHLMPTGGYSFVLKLMEVGSLELNRKMF